MLISKHKLYPVAADYNLILMTLSSNVVLLSFAAPSTAGFVGISPKVPDKTEERRLCCNRAAFSLDTF